MPSFCSCDNNILIFNTVRDLPPEWDAMLEQGHSLRSEALALYENICLPDMEGFYVLYRGDGKQVQAIAYFQLLRIRSGHLNRSLAVSSWQTRAAAVFINVFRPRLLVAGHLFRHDTCNFHAQTSLSKLEAFRIYEVMIQHLARKTCVTATLIKDVEENLVPYFQNYAPHYSQLRQDIAMEMSIPSSWTSFSDYEAAIKHKYAQKLRKVQQGMKDLRIKNLDYLETEQNKQHLYRLYVQVSTKQAFTLGYLNADFIPELKRFYGDQLQIWAFYEGEHIIAFASAWIHDTCFDMFYIDFDYNLNQKYNLYFNILYFSIGQAILFRKPKLSLGRTALEAKARLGCRPRYLSTFLHIRNVCLRALVNGRLQARHQEEGSWEERHPFRDHH